jgi:hypothetical protein
LSFIVIEKFGPHSPTYKKSTEPVEDPVDNLGLYARKKSILKEANICVTSTYMFN